MPISTIPALDDEPTNAPLPSVQIAVLLILQTQKQTMKTKPSSPIREFSELLRKYLAPTKYFR